MKKTCTRCHASIDCMADDIENCKCSRINLSTATREYLAKATSDCFCNACLEMINERINSGQQIHIDMKPKELIRVWVERFNAGDAAGIAELYHDDAVNHQVANEPVEGKMAIRAMFEQEFANAEMNCIIEQLFEDGDWGILEWRDPLGLRGCGFFHITAGKIDFQRGYWDKLSFLRIHNLPLEGHL